MMKSVFVQPRGIELTPSQKGKRHVPLKLALLDTFQSTFFRSKLDLRSTLSNMLEIIDTTSEGRHNTHGTWGHMPNAQIRGQKSGLRCLTQSRKNWSLENSKAH
ncbi:hypothetical protein KP509_20G053600 [Ceratopteris richardii]|uniref:Uncharacterized protein n=1 Tax=Ceratopteris richardii TaxID=49495 RepID=A0A8T2SIS7_CERRI|nr:hypothetical protein KP509_20G053600 [Ceratopteris richardii]